MQIKPILRTQSIQTLSPPEPTRKLESARKIAPIRDAYEDVSKRNDLFSAVPRFYSGKLLTRESLKHEQNYRHNVTFDPRKYFLSVVLQQGRVQLDSDFNENDSLKSARYTEATVKKSDD